MEVMNMVIVVELFARLGILSRLLFIKIKNILAKKANPAPKIKCQLMSILSMATGVRFEPLIKDLDPVSSIDRTVTTENRIV